MAKSKGAPQPIATVLAAKALPADPVIFAHGDEPYFIDKLVDRYEEELIPPAQRGFGQVVFYGKDSSLGQILGQAQQFPFMADRQLVIVKEAQFLDDLNREAGQNMLVNYASKATPSTTLLFAYKKKPDARKAWVGNLAAEALMLASDPIKDDALPGTIQTMFAQAGVKTDAQVPNLLAQFTGNNLSQIANEIGKLALAAGKDSIVTRELVYSNTGLSKDYNIFELQRALIDRNAFKTLQIARYYADNPKEHPIVKELAFLNNFYIRLMHYLSLRDRKKSNDEIAADIGLKSTYMLRDYEQAARNYNQAQATRCLAVLLEADRIAKGSGDQQMDQDQLWTWLALSLLER